MENYVWKPTRPLVPSITSPTPTGPQVVYVQSVESFNAGIEDGTLSGGVYFTVTWAPKKKKSWLVVTLGVSSWLGGNRWQEYERWRGSIYPSFFACKFVKDDSGWRKKRVVLFPRGSGIHWPSNFESPNGYAWYSINLGAYAFVVFGGCWVSNVFFGSGRIPHSPRSRCGWWMDLLRMRFFGVSNSFISSELFLCPCFFPCFEVDCFFP